MGSGSWKGAWALGYGVCADGGFLSRKGVDSGKIRKRGAQLASLALRRVQHVPHPTFCGVLLVSSLDTIDDKNL